MPYPVHERFLSFQGEGSHAGRKAFFIRLYGCPVHCPWCDSAGTWHPNWVPPQVARLDAKGLAEEAAMSRPEFVVLTGGEPAIFDLTPLTEELKKALPPLPIHLETSGAFTLKGRFDWITLSPKRWKLPLPKNIQAAHEYKLIIENKEDLYFYTDLLMDMGFYLSDHAPPIWLHPEWGKRQDPEVLEAITEWVLQYGPPYRAGWQVHKLYQADRKDPRSLPPVPLGGDPARGF